MSWKITKKHHPVDKITILKEKTLTGKLIHISPSLQDLLKSKFRRCFAIKSCRFVSRKSGRKVGILPTNCFPFLWSYLFTPENGSKIFMGNWGLLAMKKWSQKAFRPQLFNCCETAQRSKDLRINGSSHLIPRGSTAENIHQLMCSDLLQIPAYILRVFSW